MNVTLGGTTIAAAGVYHVEVWMRKATKNAGLHIGTNVEGAMSDYLQLLAMETLISYGEALARARLDRGDKLVLEIEFFLQGDVPKTLVRAGWLRKPAAQLTAHKYLRPKNYV
ncbi:MAG: hypothetical protein RMY34_23305 [Aulosira sp. DedQUE10]|nr:hypothetical protein [Aulosira sp. DedQUE10]